MVSVQEFHAGLRWARVSRPRPRADLPRWARVSRPRPRADLPRWARVSRPRPRADRRSPRAGRRPPAPAPGTGLDATLGAALPTPPGGGSKVSQFGNLPVALG